MSALKRFIAVFSLITLVLNPALSYAIDYSSLSYSSGNGAIIDSSGNSYTSASDYYETYVEPPPPPEPPKQEPTTITAEDWQAFQDAVAKAGSAKYEQTSNDPYRNMKDLIARQTEIENNLDTVGTNCLDRTVLLYNEAQKLNLNPEIAVLYNPDTDAYHTVLYVDSPEGRKIIESTNGATMDNLDAYTSTGYQLKDTFKTLEEMTAKLSTDEYKNANIEAVSARADLVDAYSKMWNGWEKKDQELANWLTDDLGQKVTQGDEVFTAYKNAILAKVGGSGSGTPPATTGGTPPATTGGTPPTATGGTPPAATGGTPPATTGGTPPATTASRGSGTYVDQFGNTVIVTVTGTSYEAKDSRGNIVASGSGGSWQNDGYSKGLKDPNAKPEEVKPTEEKKDNAVIKTEVKTGVTVEVKTEPPKQTPPPQQQITAIPFDPKKCDAFTGGVNKDGTTEAGHTLYKSQYYQNTYYLDGKQLNVNQVITQTDGLYVYTDTETYVIHGSTYEKQSKAQKPPDVIVKTGPIVKDPANGTCLELKKDEFTKLLDQKAQGDYDKQVIKVDDPATSTSSIYQWDNNTKQWINIGPAVFPKPVKESKPPEPTAAPKILDKKDGKAYSEDEFQKQILDAKAQGEYDGQEIKVDDTENNWFFNWGDKSGTYRWDAKQKFWIKQENAGAKTPEPAAAPAVLDAKDGQEFTEDQWKDMQAKGTKGAKDGQVIKVTDASNKSSRSYKWVNNMWLEIKNTEIDNIPAPAKNPSATNLRPEKVSGEKISEKTFNLYDSYGHKDGDIIEVTDDVANTGAEYYDRSGFYQWNGEKKRWYELDDIHKKITNEEFKKGFKGTETGQVIKVERTETSWGNGDDSKETTRVYKWDGNSWVRMDTGITKIQEGLDKGRQQTLSEEDKKTYAASPTEFLEKILESYSFTEEEKTALRGYIKISFDEKLGYPGTCAGGVITFNPNEINLEGGLHEVLHAWYNYKKGQKNSNFENEFREAVLKLAKTKETDPDYKQYEEMINAARRYVYGSDFVQDKWLGANWNGGHQQVSWIEAHGCLGSIMQGDYTKVPIYMQKFYTGTNKNTS